MMDFWIEHPTAPVRATPCGCPCACGCPFVCNCPFCGAKSGQARGPATTVHPALGQPPVVARFVRRWGNPLWLPVCSSLPVLWCQIRAGTGACPYGPPRVGATPCGCPFVRGCPYCCPYYLSLPGTRSRKFRYALTGFRA